MYPHTYYFENDYKEKGKDHKSFIVMQSLQYFEVILSQDSIYGVKSSRQCVQQIFK